MTTLEEIREIIQEWYADYNIGGKSNVAKLYATILMESENQMQYMMEDEGKNE